MSIPTPAAGPTPVIGIPHPGETLWRYMDVYRLLDLLQTSELHMTRADDMEDQWEGSRGLLHFDADGNELGPDSTYVAHGLQQMFRFGRESIFMNCWYRGESESIAMWKLYGSDGKGVALKTTVGQLNGALCLDDNPNDGNHVYGSTVDYVDYEITQIPSGHILAPFVYKRRCFEYEQEYRILEVKTPKVVEGEDGPRMQAGGPDQPRFLRRGVDLRNLVEGIYISPDTPPWIASILEKAILLYAPWMRIVISNLGRAPLY